MDEHVDLSTNYQLPLCRLEISLSEDVFSCLQFLSYHIFSHYLLSVCIQVFPCSYSVLQSQHLHQGSHDARVSPIRMLYLEERADLSGTEQNNRKEENLTVQFHKQTSLFAGDTRHTLTVGREWSRFQLFLV